MGSVMFYCGGLIERVAFFGCPFLGFTVMIFRL